jgi:hypothetical protein
MVKTHKHQHPPGSHPQIQERSRRKNKTANNKTLRLPKTSESDAAGKLMSMPGIVDAEATMPSKSSGVPRLVANGFRTGFFDMVELRIAKKPIVHIIRKNAFCVHFALSMP